MGWIAIGIEIFFAPWVSYLTSVAFVECDIELCQWTLGMLLGILMITALLMALGFLILRYDEKRRTGTSKEASEAQST
jgi:hypothetical protein